MEVGYLPFYIWTSSLKMAFIFWFLVGAVLQVVHREADFVLNLNMYSQDSCAGKLEFCHLFLKIKMGLDKLKKIPSRSEQDLLLQRGKSIHTMGMRLFIFFSNSSK